MKSVLFILHYPPPLNGGASMVGKLIRESDTINTTFNADYINLTTAFDLKKVGKRDVEKFLSIFKILSKVLSKIVTKKYDLCYMTLTATGPGFYKDFIVVCILKAFGKKIIYHFHNKGVAVASKKKLNHLLYKVAFKNTKSILLSPLLYKDIKKYVNPNDVFFCPNGVPFNGEDNWKKSSAIEVGQPCSLLFLSNMMKEKGVFVLLDACKHLKNKNIKFECHFVGAWVDVDRTDFDHFISENHLSEMIFAHGPKFGNEKIAFLKKADIFVFPSYFHNETFGLVNLEAMQYSLPIVSTFEGGIPDVVEDGITGYLVPQLDSVMLADKLECLIKKPELRTKMGIAGKERFKSLFTYEHFQENIKNILGSAALNN